MSLSTIYQSYQKIQLLCSPKGKHIVAGLSVLLSVHPFPKSCLCDISDFDGTSWEPSVLRVDRRAYHYHVMVG